MHLLRQRKRLETQWRVSWGHNFLPIVIVSSSLLVGSNAHAQSPTVTSSEASLPDAPSALLSSSGAEADAEPQSSVVGPKADESVTPQPCPRRQHEDHVPLIFRPSTKPSCQDPLQLIVETGNVSPITARQKGILVLRAFTDPFNGLTIAFFSAISVAADAHSAYGPGFAGWGRLMGYSAAEDAQATFTGVFLIPSLVHEDPRYHRMPGAPVKRRIFHALIHTVVSQHDDGSLMLNYATLINYPLTVEVSNLYVPGVRTNARSTSERILAGYATDPVGPLVAEFLPDFAKRVHIHVVFAQQILNHIALGSGDAGPAF